MEVLIALIMYLAAVILGLLILPWLFAVAVVYMKWVEKVMKRDKGGS